MTTAQKFFVVTSWLFITLSALLFLVPTSFASSEGAAWACLGVGIASHLGMFAALVVDSISDRSNPPTTG